MATLPKSYWDMVEDLGTPDAQVVVARSPNGRGAGSGHSAGVARTRNPSLRSGKPRPGYNSASKIRGTAFPGTVQDVAHGSPVPIDGGVSIPQASNPGTRRMRRNPESGAAAMYETFHQRAPERVEEYEENFHYHGWLAELGEMQEIKVALIYLDPPKEATIRFDPGTKLGCSEDGRQLYLVGGDQSVDLKSLGFGKEWTRDYMLLGVLHELTYRTKKGFDKFKTIDYYHELGEDSGDLPVLAYDNLNQQLMVVGGKYVVKYEGIVN